MRWVYDRVAAARGADADAAEEAGVVVASGVLGGESIVGVIIAFASVATGLLRVRISCAPYADFLRVRACAAVLRSR